ncbi:carboxypeptidase-like regulatory domain-containing protein [Owenweeksia hongkongensis]|uniref:carboxypeptidase-like regulatory domain-containing protein n=1 Tax=Owenweeksia hongkongensis TaxID=253245 RepID=UPI003A93781A
MRLKIILGIFALCVATSDVWAQQPKDPVQMSGIVLSGDAEPQFMPYVNIVVKKRKRGAATNSEGFFSFAVLPGDTLLFSSIGFRTETLVIPDTLDEKEYLSRVIMNRDTTMLQEVTLYPWPTPEQFKEEFLATRVPTTEEDIAMRNLAIQELKARAAKMGYSAAEIQDYVIAAKNAEIYNYGRYNNYSGGGTAILGSLSNPFAWAQFFEALKRGDFDSDSSR